MNKVLNLVHVKVGHFQYTSLSIGEEIDNHVHLAISAFRQNKPEEGSPPYF